MYGDKLSLQYQNLLTALGGGFALGLLYDMLRFLRIVCPKRKILLAADDILFPIFAAIVTYLIALSVNYGIVRFYIAAGELVGFIIYRISISYFFFPKLSGAFNAVKRFFNKAFSRLIKPINAADRFIDKKRVGFAPAVAEKTKKINLFCKIDLKRRTDVLYNKLKYSFFYRRRDGGKNEGEKKA